MFAPRVLGEVVAPSSLPAEAFGLALDAARTPLVLAPASERGWFGGHAVVAWDPVSSENPGGPADDPAARVGTGDAPSSLAQAAALLEAAFESEVPKLTAVLARYDGECHSATYGGALVLVEDGWRTWGTVPADYADVCARAAEASRACDASHDVAAHGDTSAGRQGHAESGVIEPLLVDAAWDMSGRDYRAAVQATRERIAAGDVYVLNLTARLEGELLGAPAEAFARLVERAPADLGAYFALSAGRWVASVSPERFVRVWLGEDDARLAEVCPIKGTRPRGSTPDADRELALGLLADEKERAEHVMVVDLERNDLGVSCTPGTIHVDPLYEVVQTPYCHQLVSSVRGTLRWDATFAEALGALFPCGSVTGAPKLAAMRIAAELERTPRGAYCGSLLVAVPGAMDSSVLIRTLESAEEPGRARWGAGCGITYESDPAAEYIELLLKASPALGGGSPAVALRETMRVAYGRIPLLDRHLARLALGGTGPVVLAKVRTQVAEALAGVDPALAYARLGVTVTPDAEVAVGVTEQASSLSVSGGPAIATVQVAEPPVLPAGAAKPASRRYWDLAHRTAERQGAHQAVLIDAEGRLIDGSTANIWLVSGGTLATPPAPPAVAGVAREVVFDIAAELGIPALERPLTLGDLDAADEVWLSNGVGGFVHARGRGGAVGEPIAERFEELFTPLP